ncbi:MAG: glycosyltransferase [Spirochaetia bacterium]
MKITICIMTLGTRGDVQPYLALAIGLQNAGFAVKFITSNNFKNLVQQYMIPFYGLDIDIEAIAKSEEGNDVIKMKFSSIKKIWKKMIQQMVDSWDACLEYATDADILIAHPKILTAFDIAEKLRLPLFMAHPAPLIVPIKELTYPLFPACSCGLINQLSYFPNVLMILPFKKRINTWRKNKLELAKRKQTWPTLINGETIPTLYAFSHHFFPKIKKWPELVYVTGTWNLSTKKEVLSPEIQRFLNSGPAPLCVTFGSMPMKNPARFFQNLVQVTQELNMRVIFIAGWSGIQSSHQDHILVIDEAPHHLLFPEVCAVMHHGGAGTTAATLLAKKPMIISPFIADQPFWARQMQNLGTCIAILSEKKCTRYALKKAFGEIISHKIYTKKAQELGQLLHQENGIETTVDIMMKFAASKRGA